jgi:hypothetical protein
MHGSNIAPGGRIVVASGDRNVAISAVSLIALLRLCRIVRSRLTVASGWSDDISPRSRDLDPSGSEHR